MKINLLMEAFSIAHQRGQLDIARLIWDACGREEPTAAPPPKIAIGLAPTPASPATKPVVKAATNGDLVRKPSPAQDLILGILTKFGPLTTAEVGTHAYPGQKDSKKAMGAAAAVLQDLRRKGLAERREDAESRLDKWFATGGEA